MAVREREVLSDSEEEAKSYSLREMTKSTEAALAGIDHFTRKLNSSGFDISKIALISSVISVHGKDCPEVFVLGSCLVRAWVLANRPKRGGGSDEDHISVLETAELDSMVNSWTQSCISALNFFKAKQSVDSASIQAACDVLCVILTERLNRAGAPQQANAGNALQTALSEICTFELVSSLSSEAAGSLLHTVCLLAVEYSTIFLQKQLAQFAMETVFNYKPAAESAEMSDSELESANSLFTYSLMYISMCLCTNSDAREFLIPKLVSKRNLLTELQASLVAIIDLKLSVYVVLRFISQLLTVGFSIERSTKNEEESQFFGFAGGSGSLKPKLPALFEAVDFDTLDEVLLAFTEDPEDTWAKNVALAAASIGVTCVRFYTGSTSSRASIVESGVSKWALALLMAPDPISAACGLSLVAAVAENTRVTMRSMLSVDAFKECVDCICSSGCFEWAKSEIFSLIRKAAKLESDSLVSGYLKVFVEKFNFHSGLLQDDKLKQLFFRTVSMKQAFRALLDEVRREHGRFTDAPLIVRTIYQMLSAVKAKGGLVEFQREVFLIESERVNRGNTSGSVIAGIMGMVGVLLDSGDNDGAQLGVHVLVELVPNRPAEIDKLVRDMCKTVHVLERIDRVLLGEKVKVPSTEWVGADMGAQYDCVTLFIKGGSAPSLEPSGDTSDRENSRGKPKTAKETEEAGWMDSAANWFIDYAGSEDDEAGDTSDVEERKSEKKSKKTRKVTPPPVEESEESESEEVEDDEQAVPVVAPVVPKVTLVPKAPPVAAGVSAAKPIAKAIPKIAPKVGKVAVKVPTKATPVASAPKSGALPVVAKSVVPPKAKAPPQVAPAPVKPAVVAAEVEPTDEKVKKKKKEQPVDEGGLASYFGTTDDLYQSIGGWWGAAPAADTTKKHKKKLAEVEEPVKAPAKPAPPLGPKPPPKAPPKATAPVAAKAPSRKA